MARTKIETSPPLEPEVGEPEDSADGIETLKLTWPEELFSPVQYNTFKIGGFEVVLKPKPGEAVGDMIARGEAMLERVGARQFESKLVGFLGRLRTAASEARKK